MWSFLLGAIVGFVQVGSTTWRTLLTYDGHYLAVYPASILISLSYWLGIVFIVNNNIPGYIGFSCGAAAATSLLAYQKHLRKEELNKQNQESHAKNRIQSIR